MRLFLNAGQTVASCDNKLNPTGTTRLVHSSPLKYTQYIFIYFFKYSSGDRLFRSELVAVIQLIAFKNRYGIIRKKYLVV